MGYIKNFTELTTTPQRKVVLELIEAAISSIQPENVLKDFSINNIEQYQNVYLVGFGKGSARISKIIEDKLGDKLTEGYVIDLAGEQFTKVQGVIGSHPLPSQTNVDFTKKVVDRFKGKLSKNDLVLVVVCGGGSALFELPNEGVTLDQLIEKNHELLKSGLNIEQMNIERKKLSQVKAGGLARLLVPAKVMGIIFSDVPGNNISTIASGPTDDPTAENKIMLSNKTALLAMKKKADELKVPATIYFDEVQGEAKVVGAELLKTANPGSILLAAGETTVTVKNKDGRGGRNQELVLGALSNINDRTVIASFDSDGWDNSEFAGAIGDINTVQKAKNLNLEIEKSLNENNSYDFFEKTGDSIQTGRLPSNIADIMIVYKFQP